MTDENKSEAAFIASLADHSPLIPDEIIEFYLKKTGFNCPDRRMIRLVSLAAQKFLSDIANETRQYHDKALTTGPKRKVVLSMEDLQKTLEDYGINIRKQEYFVDS